MSKKTNNSNTMELEIIVDAHYASDSELTKSHHNQVIWDSVQAASYLNISPAVLRRKARLGLIPGYFHGKWYFFKDELINCIKGLDNGTKLMPAVVDVPRSNNLCQKNRKASSRFTNDKARLHGSTVSQHQMDSAYAKLLKLDPKNKRRN